MKLAIVKMLIAILAGIGVYFPAHLRLELCNPGKSPTSAPSNCEFVQLANPRP